MTSLASRDDHGNGIPNGNGNPTGIPWEWELMTKLGMGGNGNSPVGIPWEWELVTKLGMGMGGNGNIKSHSRSSLLASTFPPGTRVHLTFFSNGVKTGFSSRNERL